MEETSTLITPTFLHTSRLFHESFSIFTLEEVRMERKCIKSVWGALELGWR